ncbi:hypothetical protein T261_7015 [Streptomyces lydicus]|nr:hypothetical protein T261_7015 [Streptomyces lydicus]
MTRSDGLRTSRGGFLDGLFPGHASVMRFGTRPSSPPSPTT